MTIIITESAADDIASGSRFYERQESGLGSYFKGSIFSDIESLRIYAGTHEVHFSKYYRKIAGRFPYAIYYSLDDDVIGVYAVVDTRRDPTRIVTRLGGIG